MNNNNRQNNGQQSQNNTKSAKSKKNARRRARKQMAKANNRPYVGSSNVYPQPPAVAPIQNSFSKAMSKYTSSTPGARRLRISEKGMAFLKCAFAPPDFNQTNVAGVPDEFQGMSLIKKHKSVNSISFGVANTDYYFLLAPIPGYAYFTTTCTGGQLPTNASVWTGTTYIDTPLLFNSLGTAGQSTADVVNKFRFVSNHFELIPTTNQMTWTGSIQAFKVPLAFVTRPNYGTSGAEASNIATITGLNGADASNANQYTSPFNMGFFSGAYNIGAKFDFQTIPEGFVNVPQTINSGDFGQLACASGFTGLDANVETIMIKVTGNANNTNNSAIIKTWACVEYQCVPGTILYDFQTFSPCDLEALALYRKIVNDLPVGVSFLDNESFWQRVLSIIKNISAVGIALPGPYGLASVGVNSLARAVEAFL